jgi:hypothetical protein
MRLGLSERGATYRSDFGASKASAILISRQMRPGVERIDFSPAQVRTPEIVSRETSAEPGLAAAGFTGEGTDTRPPNWSRFPASATSVRSRREDAPE